MAKKGWRFPGGMFQKTLWISVAKCPCLTQSVQGHFPLAILLSQTVTPPYPLPVPTMTACFLAAVPIHRTLLFSAESSYPRNCEQNGVREEPTIEEKVERVKERRSGHPGSGEGGTSSGCLPADSGGWFYWCQHRFMVP